jgi:hypothetical protein
MYSYSSFEFFYENDKLNGRLLNQIDDLKAYLEDKLFIFVCGCDVLVNYSFINNILKKVIGNLPINDGDNSATKISGSEYKREKDFPNAIAKKESFIYTNNNIDLNESIENLYLAKANGFTTVLIYIDVPEEFMIKQVQQRSNPHERTTIEDSEIIRNKKNSKEVFDKINKDRDLVDFYYSYKK